MSKNIFSTLSEKKNQIFAMLVKEIMMSDYSASLIEKLIQTGGMIDQKIQQALNTFRVGSKREIEDLEDRLNRLEKKLTRAITSIEELREKVDSRGGKTEKKAMAGVCDNCGKQFRKKSFNQKFCSAACRGEFSSKQAATKAEEQTQSEA